MYPVLFKIGSLTLYTYGFCIFVGVLMGYFVCMREAKREDINPNVFSNIFFWALIFGFMGARIFYIFVEWKIFLADPIGIIFSRSGFVFYGGVIFSLSGLYLLTSKYKIIFLKFVDILAVGVPLAHVFGRLGCFFYGCCYGRAVNSWIGMRFPPISPAGLSGVKVIPTQLISAFFLLIIFFILLVLKKRKKFDGQILLSYLVFYGVFRFIIEFFRGDPRGRIFFLSTSQFISFVMVTLSIFLFYRWMRRA